MSELCVGSGDFPEEAASVSEVAGDVAEGLDLEDHGVQVAVHEDLVDDLEVSAGFALYPEFLSGSRPVGCLSGGEGGVPCLLVEVCLHEDFAGFPVLCDDGDESVGIFCEVELHCCCVVSEVVRLP